jgi:phage terminase small subunit
MLSKPHRKFCEAIVSGLTGVRAYALAYPHCSLKTARFNASHLRAKPHIQQEIARLRAQADAIVGPTVLTLIEKRLWLARVVRANLARLDPEIDGDLLVSLHVEKEDKKRHVSRIRIANKLAAIRLDTRLAGDEPTKSKLSPMAQELLAAGGTQTSGGMVIPPRGWGWGRMPTAPKTSPSNSGTPQEFKIHNSKFNIPPLPTSPDTPASEDPQELPNPQAYTSSQPAESSNASADSQGPVESHAPSGRQAPEEPPTSADHEDHEDHANSTDSQNSKSKIQNPTFPPEPPIDSGYIAPVFPPPRPRFDPGPDYAARQRAKRRQPVVRHLWDQH